MSLEDLMNVEIDSVYGASGYKQKVTEAPASISIVTADEIRRYGYRTLADILRNVPGFYVTYDRNYSYLAVRGFGRPGDYNSRIMLLIDGHRSNDNIFDEALIGQEFPLDIALIERVEVIRGPNSSIYVASAFLGVINIVTRRASQAQGMSLSGSIGSYGTYQSRLAYGRQFGNGVGVLVSGTYYNSNGQTLYFPEFDAPATNGGVAQGADYENSRQFFADITYGNLRLEGVYGWRRKGIPTGSFDTMFNNSSTRTIDSRGYLDLAYDRNFGGDWGIAARLSYDASDYDGTYAYAASDGSGAVLNRDLANGKWWGAELAISKRLFNRHTMIAGSEYRDNFRQFQTNYDEQPYLEYFTSAPHSSLWAVFAQDEIRLNRTLTLDVGLRHDHYSTFGGTTNPRAGLIYQPWGKTTLKLLYGQSFRAPNAYELYYAGAGQDGNPYLRPENAKTTELVLEQYFGRGNRLLVSGYYYPVSNLIGQATDPASGDIVYVNGRRIEMRGVEFSFKKQWQQSGLEAGTSLSIQSAHDSDSGVRLTNSPRVLGHGQCSVPLLRRRVFASANVNYVSRRLTNAGSYTAGYVLPDVIVLGKWSRQLQVSAGIYNILNRRYADPAGIGDPENIIRQDGVNFRVSFTYNLGNQ